MKFRWWRACVLGVWLVVAGGLVARASAGDAAVGRGSFEMDGLAIGRREAPTLEVFTYRPASFTPASPVIVVLAGEERNAKAYRDAWAAPAEHYGLLVVAPGFPHRNYPGAEHYNLARMPAGSLKEGRKVRLRPKGEWLFAEIERAFDLAREEHGAHAEGYDLFGHSAGAQLVHRQVLFAEETRIRRAVAANAGWYTLPTEETAYPYGLAGLPSEVSDLGRAFQRPLTVLLGERDDDTETRGRLRRTPGANAQGPHRFARGLTFFDTARRASRAGDLDFTWHLETVDGVGHDYEAMSAVAADLLYGDPRE